MIKNPKRNNDACERIVTSLAMLLNDLENELTAEALQLLVQLPLMTLHG